MSNSYTPNKEIATLMETRQELFAKALDIEAEIVRVNAELVRHGAGLRVGPSLIDMFGGRFTFGGRFNFTPGGIIAA